ncbi:hypothetical protein F6X40_17120 [Paraburkholderia sp. UCT31]|uniref:hypothetical protein n=1 Tax=Paraburkholderia sp. UCT31 TaxID=2615209 RepID=UPI001656645D|nr:hypothetical protein [Paraburkholderia sp. UCT31]MBC8738497.1 hypothetical protein [Paraburkholderia sp. UCT31]
MKNISQSLNIFSGTPGLGGALTAPTELAYRKGSIQARYPVEYAGKRYPDVELAYKVLTAAGTDDEDELFASLLAHRFEQHPALLNEVTRRGGVGFLERCSHLTGGKSVDALSWEGTGRASRYITVLIRAYEMAMSGEVEAKGQVSLF